MITKSIMVDYRLWQDAINKAGWKGSINQIIAKLLQMWVDGKIEIK